jgi:hypothetical protein
MPSSRLLRAALITTIVGVTSLVVAAPKNNGRHPHPGKGSGSGSGSAAGSAGGSDAGSADATPAAGSDAGSGAGSNAGSAMTPSTPTPTTPPAGDGSAAPALNPTDVDALRQEYLSLRDELYKSRARANAVASQLYSTRITLRFTWASGRFYGVNKASIRLDGATVFEDAAGAIAGDDGVRFDGYIAPGRHLVTFHVEATGKDDDSFTSSTESQVVVKAVPNKDLVVAAKGKDSGDIAFAWKKVEHGSYGLGIDVAVKTVPHGTADATGGKAEKKK